MMEWIEGTKLTDVQRRRDYDGDSTIDANGAVICDNRGDKKSNTKMDKHAVKENLELVKVAIDSTLSQLLVTGVLHAGEFIHANISR